MQYPLAGKGITEALALLFEGVEIDGWGLRPVRDRELYQGHLLFVSLDGLGEGLQSLGTDCIGLLQLLLQTFDLAAG